MLKGELTSAFTISLNAGLEEIPPYEKANLEASSTSHQRPTMTPQEITCVINTDAWVLHKISAN